MAATYWGYVCRSHEPEIESEHWFNRGAGLLAEVYQLERAGQWVFDPRTNDDAPVWNPQGTYSTHGPITWLRQHPSCDVALRSEYGDTREIANPQEGVN